MAAVAVVRRGRHGEDGTAPGSRRAGLPLRSPGPPAGPRGPVDLRAASRSADGPRRRRAHLPRLLPWLDHASPGAQLRPDRRRRPHLVAGRSIGSTPVAAGPLDVVLGDLARHVAARPRAGRRRCHRRGAPPTRPRAHRPGAAVGGGCVRGRGRGHAGGAGVVRRRRPRDRTGRVLPRVGSHRLRQWFGCGPRAARAAAAADLVASRISVARGAVRRGRPLARPLLQPHRAAGRRGARSPNGAVPPVPGRCPPPPAGGRSPSSWQARCPRARSRGRRLGSIRCLHSCGRDPRCPSPTCRPGPWC